MLYHAVYINAVVCYLSALRCTKAVNEIKDEFGKVHARLDAIVQVNIAAPLLMSSLVCWSIHLLNAN